MRIIHSLPMPTASPPPPLYHAYWVAKHMIEWGSLLILGCVVASVATDTQPPGVVLSDGCIVYGR